MLKRVRSIDGIDTSARVGVISFSLMARRFGVSGAMSDSVFGGTVCLVGLVDMVGTVVVLIERASTGVVFEVAADGVMVEFEYGLGLVAT